MALQLPPQLHRSLLVLDLTGAGRGDDGVDLPQRLKDEAVEQETKRREEVEEKLRASEQAGEELQERTRKDAQEHAVDLWKHRAAFAELASVQRQLEAELANSVEAELRAVLERRDEATATAEELSAKAAWLRRNAKHKDKILSVVMRKSKMDMEDREMLVREVKVCKTKRKQAELEAVQWCKMQINRCLSNLQSADRFVSYMHQPVSSHLSHCNAMSAQ